MILDIQNVTKQYDGTKALDSVSLQIPKGKIFGLLGPNGAGKTSLIRIITQITRADSGSILFNERPMNLSDTENIGYLPEERGLYNNMKIEEQLIYLTRLKGSSKKEAQKQISEWFNKFEIHSWKGKKINELSKGMQQKVQFISTLLHNPNLIIFDEPFTGLDPINTELIKNEIRELRNAGVSIIFSTHRMEQVEEICEEIALINHGEILLNGKVNEIKQKFKKNHFRIVLDKPFEFINTEHFTVISQIKNSAILHSVDSKPNEILQYFINDHQILHFEELLPSLNEIFIDQVKGVSYE